MAKEEEASYRMKEAIRYYNDWGAVAKVEQLAKEYEFLLPLPHEIVSVGKDAPPALIDTASSQ